MPAVPTQGAASKKTKVAILGAGLGSISTAFELTQLPENRDKYDITVYQMGWRVGGKGASGRNAQMGSRIEEHGLHIWFGFYENAFKALRAAYGELGRPPGTPLSTIEKAFTPHDFVVLMDQYQGGWRTPWEYTFPPNKDVAGESTDLPSFWSLAYLAVSGLAIMLDTALINAHDPCSDPPPDAHAHSKGNWWDVIKTFVSTTEKRLLSIEVVPAAAMLAIAAGVLKAIGGPAKSLELKLARDIEIALCDMLAKYRAWLWDTYGCHVDVDSAREALVIADATLTTMIGMMRDEVRTKGIFSIDDVELSTWFTKHGANPVTLTCPLVRALYDNIFAYEHGDVSKPNAAAGTSLLWLLRMILTYKGHLMYKMNAGMGDTIFAPFYEVLKRRGVKFKFFHCVTNLGLDGAKTAIDTIQVMQQVDLTVDDYDPFVIVKDLPCWPNQPNWNQIKDGAKFEAEGVNLEQVLTPYIGRQPMTLRRGTDFDIVVLGIPVSVLPSITPELCNNEALPAWKAMCDNVQTVQTQAYQVWMNRNLESVGWITGTDSPVLGTYVELIDTYADMSQLIPVEDQPPSENVQSIAYFCGAMPDTKTQADADALAYRNSFDNLVNGQPRLWRNLRRDDGTVDWAMFVDPNDGKGPDRFKAQFVRANWTGTERYTLSVAGSTKYRIRADQTGYGNLYIAGDWTENHFNSGCVEATVMSGMLASRAICGYPQTIVGQSPDLWEGDR